jgi:hypothetical protein
MKMSNPCLIKSFDQSCVLFKWSDTEFLSISALFRESGLQLFFMLLMAFLDASFVSPHLSRAAFVSRRICLAPHLSRRICLAPQMS